MEQDDEEVDMSDLKKNMSVMGITKTIAKVKYPMDNHALQKNRNKNKRNRSQLRF